MQKKGKPDAYHGRNPDTRVTGNEEIGAIHEPPSRDRFPFDALADHGEGEYRTSHTRSLRDIAAVEGVIVNRADAFQKLLDFLGRLKAESISFELKYIRDDTIMVLIRVPGEFWEVEFFADGHIEVEVLRSVAGGLGGEELLERLFEENSDS